MGQVVIEKTLVDIVARHAREKSDFTAFQFEGRVSSYAQFDTLASKVAAALDGLGLRHGDRVAYIGKNSDLYFELLLGAMKIGAVVVPVNWRLAAPEMIYIIDNAEAPALFVGPEFADAARGFMPKLSHVKHVVLMEGADAQWPTFAAWRDGANTPPPAVRLDENDVAVQLYTSGTTGHPKGAMLSHRNLLDLRDEKYGALPDWNSWTADDVALLAMPVFHIAGTGWGIYSLTYGAKCVIVRDFDPGVILDTIQNERVSKLLLVPAAMQFVVRHPRAREVDYSRLKYLIYGASPIPIELLKECMDVFRCGFVQMYGMTETTGAASVLSPEDHSLDGNIRMRSAGKALAGVEIAILDADGAPVATGEIGEICTRSSANMVGYWKQPEATKATITADGWLRTGDAGSMDEHGFIYVQDRIKDMIISGAENIYPAEVENAIFGHPGVADVAVVGVPDDTWGESVKAIVVRKAGAEVSPDDIIAWSREKIAGFKTPKSVDFIDALPRNASGKILRRQLREPYWEGRSRRVN